MGLENESGNTLGNQMQQLVLLQIGILLMKTKKAKATSQWIHL